MPSFTTPSLRSWPSSPSHLAAISQRPNTFHSLAFIPIRENKEEKQEKITHLLHTTRQQRPILRIYPLHHHPPPIPTPRALNLRKHPLIRPHPLRLVEIYAVVQAHQHPHPRPRQPVLQLAAQALKLEKLLQRRPLVLWQRGHFFRRHAQPPQLVDPRHHADEVTVRDVRQRVEVRLMPAAGRDLAPAAMPLPRPALIRPRLAVVHVEQLDPPALKRPLVPRRVRLAIPARLRHLHALGQRSRVTDLLGAAAGLAHEADCRGEDALALLPRLHRPRGKGPAVAHALDVVHDGDRRRARQQEIAVARVHQKVVLDRQLRRRQALRNHGAAVDATRSRRQPQRARVGEDVLSDGEWD